MKEREKVASRRERVRMFGFGRWSSRIDILVC